MSVTKEFFKAWMRENVGNLPAEQEISIPVLAQQFEQDAEAAGYGPEVRQDELGDIVSAIEEELGRLKAEEMPAVLSDAPVDAAAVSED